MDKRSIKFVSNRAWLNKDSVSTPISAAKMMCEWYKKADRFVKDPNTDEYVIGQDGGKMPTWKACPAIFDVMISGYFLKTPCDVHFYLDDNGKINCRIDDENYQDFCTPRPPMAQFYQPDNYYLDHFSWFIDWGIELPPGYSALYLTPMNRFDLPFINTVGIIDNDKINLSGSLPFFLQQGFTGTIPAGTPYVQIFPFKREDWQSEIVIEDPKILHIKNYKNSKKYRVKDGGVYKNEVWEKRTYE
jgi:hypothetical protein